MGVTTYSQSGQESQVHAILFVCLSQTCDITVQLQLRKKTYIKLLTQSVWPRPVSGTQLWQGKRGQGPSELHNFETCGHPLIFIVSQITRHAFYTLVLLAKFKGLVLWSEENYLKVRITYYFCFMVLQSTLTQLTDSSLGWFRGKGKGRNHWQSGTREGGSRDEKASLCQTNLKLLL